MKDEKEINTSTEKSNEELEAALDKTEEYAEEELHDELEKLAATFRNELNKAKEQGAVKIGAQDIYIHIRYRNHITDPVQQHDENGKDQFLPQFGNTPSVLQCLEHLNHLGLSACLLDLFLCRLRESRCLNGQFLGDSAVGQNLQTIGALVDNTCLDQSGSVHNSAILKTVQGGQVDSGQGLCVNVVETTLGYAADQGHLAAFEAGTDLAAGAGLLALVTTTTGLAVAGTVTAALTLAHLGGASDRREFMELHNRSPPYSTSVTCSR